LSTHLFSHIDGFAVKRLAPELNPEGNISEIQWVNIKIVILAMQKKPSIPYNPWASFQNSMYIFFLIHLNLNKPAFQFTDFKSLWIAPYPCQRVIQNLRGDRFIRENFTNNSILALIDVVLNCCFLIIKKRTCSSIFRDWSFLLMFLIGFRWMFFLFLLMMQLAGAFSRLILKVCVVVSLNTTRNSRISYGITCGIEWIIRRKGVSCGFCQGFALPGNTFVGNYFLRILATAGNFPTEISSGTVKSIRRKPLVRVGVVSHPVNVSCENTAGISAANSTCNSTAVLFQQVNPQETVPIRRKVTG